MSTRTLAALTAVAAAAVAHADVVRFTFQGVVTRIEGPLTPPPEIHVGAPMLITYAFRTDTPDADPAPNAGDFRGAIIRARADINSVAFEVRAGDIGIIDDGFAGDSYLAYFEDPIRSALVSLTNLGGNAFQGDALPLDLDIDLFQLRDMQFERVSGPAFYRVTADVHEFSVLRIACVCDWNADGVVNSQDFFEYVADFLAGESAPCPPCLDLNGDGVVNSQDAFEFLNCFFAGCGD